MWRKQNILLLGKEQHMKIEKEKVRRRFKQYTEHYNAEDPKIALKIHHTYRVAELCSRIARAEDMDEKEQELAWLLGMLHDIGRFEQLRRYDTFDDAKSIDHAMLGADLLFQGEDAKIREYAEDASEDGLIETAIRQHSAYRIPEDLDKRTEKFCNILRDADKIDILRVNTETPLEEIYNASIQELYHAEVTEAVMESFYEHHATLRSLKRSSVDHIAGHVSLIFELVFPESIRIVKEQGYWEKLIGFPSENKKTREQFRCLKQEMQKFLENKILDRECGQA